MARLEEIWIYPVKGCRGIQLESSEVTHRGLRYDRRMMVVDAEGMFASQRSDSNLAQIATAISGVQLILSFGKDSIAVPLDPVVENLQTVQVWQSEVRAGTVSHEADALLSKSTGKPYRLVYMPDRSKRRIATGFRRGREQVSFADGFPLLLTNLASLDDLSSQVGESVPMNRFRPNLVMRHDAPWEEDRWHRLRVGNLRFYGPKPCGRCLVITTDQETGERKGPEPLKTLAKINTIDGKAIFGRNLIPHDLGCVRVGDVITPEW